MYKVICDYCNSEMSELDPLANNLISVKYPHGDPTDNVNIEVRIPAGVDICSDCLSKLILKARDEAEGKR